MKPWYERDEFWEKLLPTMFREERWDAAVGEVDALLALISLAPGAAVLDLPCGPGRHSLELARRGFRVTSVDRTAEYLDQARQRADEEGLTVEWVQSDMREFRRPEAFDAAINMFTSFGYFEDPDDDRKVVGNLLSSLRSGGVLVMDMMGKEVQARLFRNRDWHEYADGTILLEERAILPGWERTEARWIVLKDAERTEFRFSHRIYSAVELSSLLRGSGFTSVEVYGSLEGTPYDHTAKRLVVVARKA